MNKHPERTVVLSENDAKQFLRQQTRRSFLTAGIAGVAAFGGYKWMRSRTKEDMVPWPQRSVLSFNEKIAHGYLSDTHRATVYQPSEIGSLKPNGEYGLDDDLDADAWRLHVQAGDTVPPLQLTLADIKALPRYTQVTKLHCIEGWSTVVQWSGARFVDFTRKYFPAGAPFPDYVSMETPDSEYYVGLDAKSALHPQTLLCYERNGQPLEEEHGAPLRLVVPVKYGIKNIKRIGLIRYTATRPKDYWAEQGYDWFAGL
jgi:DMSO/TMAO reductase YedYZ molybdopterin-dependent catalytic subunit